MSVVFVNNLRVKMGIWICFEENDWCYVEKTLKMWPFQWASIPPRLSDLRRRPLGIRAVHVSRFGERRESARWSCPFRTTHTPHLPPVVHHKPSASHLLRTSRCGAKIHDNLCIHLTSLFSHFILASGGSPLFTWQEHQALMQRFPAVALPLRTCFSAFIQFTLFFPFPNNCTMYPPGLSAL